MKESLTLWNVKLLEVTAGLRKECKLCKMEEGISQRALPVNRLTWNVYFAFLKTRKCIAMGKNYLNFFVEC